MTTKTVSVWDELFSSRAWGRYPPEELVRFMGRNYKDPARRGDIKVLELGCGPGANIWFLHREGYATAGIDFSPTAIEQSSQRIQHENASSPAPPADLRTGDFCQLPWEDASFDVVIDIHAIYANRLSVISSVIAESHRVLKPGGRHFSKMWGLETTGAGDGVEIEPGTWDDIQSGPCQQMGVSHFFDREEIQNLFAEFQSLNLDEIRRTDNGGAVKIQEWIVEARK